jgi:hypothetical protein
MGRGAETPPLVHPANNLHRQGGIMLEFYGEYKAKLAEYQDRLTALRSFL